MAEEKLNNPAPGSEKEQPKEGTGLDKKDEGGEKLLAGKFKSEEELVKAYQNLEADSTRKSQEASEVKERIAKLEGMLEMQQKQAQESVPQITEEEYKKMTENFKQDFDDPLRALNNFNRPLRNEIERTREELRALKEEIYQRDARRSQLAGLADEARKEDPKLFEELKPDIEKELREDTNLAKYENPYQAAFYKVLGKSYKRLAKGTDAERESHVEGSSPVPPEAGKLTKEQAYKRYVVEKGRRSTTLI